MFHIKRGRRWGEKRLVTTYRVKGGQRKKKIEKEWVISG